MKKSLLILLLATGCTWGNPNNAYNTIPSGSELSVDYLKRAEQIVKVGKDVILSIDMSIDKGEYYNPHLFFFDSTGRFSSEVYYASGMIDSVKDKTIFGLLNKTRLYRASPGKDHLPEGYKLKLVKDTITGTMNNYNVVIKEINLLGLSDTAKLIIKRYDKILEDTIAIGNRGFKTDTLLITLDQLIINYNKHVISTGKVVPGYYVFDHMYFKDTPQMDAFYLQVYRMLKGI